MKPSAEVREFIKGWEKLSLVRYLDSAGKPTIGWGHLILPVDGNLQTISHLQACELFDGDLDRHANALNMYITCDPTQQQYDAVLDLAFNEGVKAIGNSTLMRNLNVGAIDDAADQFIKWIFIHDPQTGRLVESDGLKKRRAAEQQIFVRGVYDSSH